MKPEIEEIFDHIMLDAIARAEGVKCKPKQFLEGLRLMRETLDERINSYAFENGK